MKVISAVACLIAAASSVAYAQPPATPAFEVASIKPAPPPSGNNLMVRMGGDPGRIDYANVSLKDVIRLAYRVKNYQIAGPDWLESARFNIVAKLPEGSSREQV